MSSLEEERNNEAYQYAIDKGQISLDKLLKLKVQPTIFRSICWHNGYIVENVKATIRCGAHGHKQSTIFYLTEKREKRYKDGIELTACSVPKSAFLNSSGEYGCLHHRQCQCYSNGNCDIGGL